MSTTHRIGMARASEADLEAAVDLCSSLNAIQDGLDPANEDMAFNEDSPADCQRALRHLLAICERGSLFRVVWGMRVLMDPQNKVVDPDSPTLEVHPRFAAMEPPPEGFGSWEDYLRASQNEIGVLRGKLGLEAP